MIIDHLIDDINRDSGSTGIIGIQRHWFEQAERANEELIQANQTIRSLMDQLYEAKQEIKRLKEKLGADQN